ncbi:Protein CHROMATIN REMODELING 25 [Vigna angularis]|uniref:Protein CHROMATIN REMODELING 25 n=1 Tax=Phaseolus angularis TaxID=3914 RepID=A0A8T0JHF5_PHAAN|nr:Protein CHROMATIN REMODELING 25 [Vigna angularis]
MEENEMVWCSSDSCSSDSGEEDIEERKSDSCYSDSGEEDIEERKSQNVDAVVRGNLVVKRQSLLPRLLSVSQGAVVCRKPFKPPSSKTHASTYNQDLTRRLSARKRFVPWGSSSPIPRPAISDFQFNVSVTDVDVPVSEEPKPSLPPGIDPLVLWHPQDSHDDPSNTNFTTITVDPLLVRYLRPHQREGVQFMFDCVSGLCTTPNIHGCILADDMGLGKTLQSITLLYTLLCQGFDGKPLVRKSIIVTPTSLVSNWEAEIKKWVGERVRLVALCESSREDVVLIVSYETFRMHSSKFSSSDSCDLLICDEAHRLKNDQTITNRALAALPCKRRILLSGTPLQNDLEEFFAMVNFTNPGILGSIAHFRRYYEAPIICGREPAATVEEKKIGAERSAELSVNVNRVKRAITEELKQSKILAYITALKKLCNHPKLIYDTIRSGSPGTSGFEECIRFFPPEMLSGRSGSWTGGHGAWVELSGKMHVLARLLAHLRHRTNDRIVLVSNYTQDEFVFLLSSKAGGCGLNLIGGNRLVLFDPDWNPANDKQAAARVWRDGQKKRVYIYRFLSAGTIEEKVYQRQMSKEGLQKVIQQEQTDSLVSQGNFLSTEDLRDLFTFHENIKSEIHEKMRCSRCETHGGPQSTDAQSTAANESGEENSDIGGFAEIAGCLQNLKRSEKQVGSPLEEDLGSWGHHFLPNSVPDATLQASAGDEVTFVFTNQVNGRLVPIESKMSPKLQKKEPNKELLKSMPTPISLQNRLPLQSASGVASMSSSTPNVNSMGIRKNISNYSLVSKVLPHKRSRPADISYSNFK